MPQIERKPSDDTPTQHLSVNTTLLRVVASAFELFETHKIKNPQVALDALQEVREVAKLALSAKQSKIVQGVGRTLSLIEQQSRIKAKVEKRRAALLTSSVQIDENGNPIPTEDPHNGHREPNSIPFDARPLAERNARNFEPVQRFQPAPPPRGGDLDVREEPPDENEH